MATLILTAVGTAIGGPIGGALGALAGQAIDARVLRAKGREGPRLTELAVQTSSYGTPIPLQFGTMRVAGTVIWSTDLIEHATTDGGGKGRGSTTSYSYSASFAVLLSARAVRSIGRIWADGKLLRGAAGDFKSPTRFRSYPGDEAQTCDPLIAAAEGEALTPACRGQAYVVFEELALADFGNRIPSLTFEVVCDAGPVRCATIAQIASAGRVVAGDGDATLAGYSAYGDALRDVVDGLAFAGSAWLAAAGDRIEMRSGAGAALTIEDSGVAPGMQRQRTIAAADAAPRRVIVQHHDPDRDYQSGVQRAVRVGAGEREQHIALPAAITAGNAKALAGAVMMRADVERERRTISTDWRSVASSPGDRVTIAGEDGQWRIVDWSLEHMVVTLELVRIARAPAMPIAATGRVLGARDIPVGTTIVHAFEIPATDDALPTAPHIFVAAAGTEPGWRGAALQLSLDGGVSWTAAGVVREPAVLGWIAATPGAASSTLIDRRSTIDVILPHAATMLHDADDAALDRGANLALIGDELLQYGRAEQVAPTRWRLRDLWRGRRGTEAAIGTAQAGDRFAVIDPRVLARIEVPTRTIGGEAHVIAAGVGDDDAPATATAAITGVSVTPPSPVHVDAHTPGDGLARLRWVRRSRAGWHWSDRIDAPLSEESEHYEIRVVRAGTSDDVTVVTEPRAIVSTGGADAVVSVRQIGTHGASRASTPLSIAGGS